MSIVSKSIAIWKEGLTIFVVILLFGFVAPLSVAILGSAVIIFPMYLLGLSLEFWDNNANIIVISAVVILGPYFLGKQWREIQDAINKIFENKKLHNS